MRRYLILLFLLTATASCDRPTSSNRTVSNEERQAALVELRRWFPTDQDVAAYFRQSQLAATGRVTSRNGPQLRIELEHVFQGTAEDDAVEVLETGGLVRPQVGDSVIVLANQRDGRWMLHSYCPVPGLFYRTAELERLLPKSHSGAPQG